MCFFEKFNNVLVKLKFFKIFILVKLIYTLVKCRILKHTTLKHLLKLKYYQNRKTKECDEMQEQCGKKNQEMKVNNLEMIPF